MGRRFNTIVIALLLATLPVMGLAAFAREGHSACAMQMKMQAPMHDEHGMSMSDHCKSMMAHAAKAACKRGAHCSMCDDPSTALAITELPVPAPTAAQGIMSSPTEFFLDSTVATLWRPPRYC